MVIVLDEKAVPGVSAGTTLLGQRVLQPSPKGERVDLVAEISTEARLK